MLRAYSTIGLSTLAMAGRSLVVLVFGFSCLAVGCAKRLSSPQPPLPPVGASAHDDNEIYEIALTDMIGNAEFDPAVGGRRVRKSQIVLANTTRGALSDRLRCQVSDVPVAISSELRADLLRRNAARERYSLKGYRPSNSNIIVADLSGVDVEDGFDKVFPDARGYVRPFLPGYSKDGRLALFFFHFGPSSHGAVGHYLLGREHARWRVISSSFGYFN
jgi:hypothetical protein